MLQQGCLNVVGRILLAPNHIEDTGLIELIGHEVLIFASCGHHIRIGIDGTLQQHGGSYGHEELIHGDIALQRGQRVVWTVTAYGTFQSERGLIVILTVAQHTSRDGTTL